MTLRWLKTHWEKIPLGTILVATISIAIWATPPTRRIEDEIARRIEFNARELLGKEPVLDARIKIFGYDDSAAATEFSQETVTLRDWALVIKSLAANKPAQIVFDKIFPFPDKDESENAFFVKTVRETGVPVYAAVFSLKHDIAGRTPIRLSGTCQLPKASSSLPKLVSENWRFFGPATQLSDAFTGLGHIDFSKQSRYPIAFFKPTGECAPFLAAVASQNYEFTGNTVRIGKSLLAPDPEGEIQPNITKSLHYFKKTISLKGVFALARQGKPVPIIKPGDTVVVLPALYTGNTDFKRTPLGDMEGGFFHVANMNSVLTGKWLGMHGYGWSAPFLILVFALAGLLASRFLSSAKAALFTLTATSLTAICGILFFAHMGYMLFWFLPAVTLLATSTVELIAKSVILERRARKIGAALEGLVPRHVLKVLQKNPNAFEFKPQKIYVTIMFLDVEGFSVRFEGVEPNVVFGALQKQLSRLCAIVHEHGGIIDKTLGDGLLAFFGHSYDPLSQNNALTNNHTEQALTCAAAIQKEWAERMIQAEDAEQPLSRDANIQPMPLRIGINTGEVFLGDLGSGDRVDVTIVGDAVNFAKRLEDSANPFRIMIGSPLKEILEKQHGRVGKTIKEISFRKVLLQIKHHPNLIEAWEADPFAGAPHLLQKALYSARSHKQRRYARIAWHESQIFEVLINGDIKGRLIDFSDTGFCIEMQEYFARKVQTNIELAINIPAVQALLRAADVGSVLAEVRWGSLAGSKTRHGFRILNLSSEQRSRLYKLLSENNPKGIS